MIPVAGVRRYVLPTVAAVVSIAIFCVLGVWQIHRAQEKRSLQAAYDRRGAQPPIALNGDRHRADALRFFRVQAHGAYETDYRMLWDNRIHHDVPGYDAISAFRIAGSRRRVLVDRGWVPLGPDRRHPPPTPVPRGPVTITGIAVVPERGFSLGALDPLARTGVTVWQQLDLALYARQTGWPLEPIVIQLDPQSPGGFVRAWPRPDAGVTMHQGYAFEWFMFAATALVLYVVLMRRAIRRNRPVRAEGVQ